MTELFEYVINLDDRKDRRREMDEQLRRIGWRAQFSNSDRPKSINGFPSIGAHGCFMSHLSTLRRGQIMEGHVVLMEDDLDFTPGFSALWSKAMAELETMDWSIFYPAHTLTNVQDGLIPVHADQKMMCAHFVMFNKNAVSRVIDGLETIMTRPPGHPLGGPMHIDGAYTIIRKQNPDLRTYLHSPSLGHQRPSRSDIANVGIIDRIDILRPIVSQLRQIKRTFR